MSRIILSRHLDGEPRLIAGWDRPMRSAFVDLYDDEGEVMVTRGPMEGERLSPQDAVQAAVDLQGEGHDLGLDITAGLPSTVLLGLLIDHSELEFPESNRVVDLTTDAEWRTLLEAAR